VGSVTTGRRAGRGVALMLSEFPYLAGIFGIWRGDLLLERMVVGPHSTAGTRVCPC
jgi:hypothetical protein